MGSGNDGISRRSVIIVTVCLDKYAVAEIRDAIKTVNGFEVRGEFGAYANETGAEYLADHLRQRRPDVCIIDFDKDRQKAALTAEQIRDNFPEVAVFASSTDANPDLIIQAMHSGCSEYLVRPAPKDRIVQALVRVELKRKESVPAAKGSVYTFVGAKGGMGVTTLATHVAAYCARQGAKTLLIDQHTDLGDVSVYLSLGNHQYHFYELVNNIHRLDAQLVEGFLQHHHSGLDVLPSPESFGSVVQASPTALHHTLSFLREIYDVVIVDCYPGLNGLNVIAIEEADAVYLVGVPELAAVRNLARYLDHLKKFNCSANKIHVVINRYSKRAAITQQQIEKAIQTRVSRVVPNSYPDVIAAIHSGEPIPYESRSELASALRDWASSLAQNPVHGKSAERVEPKRRFGILGL